MSVMAISTPCRCSMPIALMSVAVQGFLDRLVDRGASHGWHVLGRAWRGVKARFRYLAQEHGARVEVVVAIKKALDPLNILNPGKIFGLP